MAYEWLNIAERTNHLITLHLGVMARAHKDENAYSGSGPARGVAIRQAVWESSLKRY
jgi:hypothetical protein